MTLSQLIEKLQALSAEVGPDAPVGVRDTCAPKLGKVWGVEVVSTGKKDPEKIVSRQGVRTVAIFAVSPW